MLTNNPIITTTLNDKSYTAKKLSAWVGVRHGLYLTKLLLPCLGAGLDGITSPAEQPKTFSDITYRLVQSLEDDTKLMKVVEDLFQGFTVGDDVISFDTYFMANYGELLTALEWLLKENFQSLFTGGGIQEKAMGALTGILSIGHLQE